jgi:hypothetical protein
MELKDGKAVPFAPRIMPPLETPLALRIRRDWLWALDHGNFGRGTPRIVAWDISQGDALVHQFKFPREVAGFGSMLNDFQVGPLNENVYITEASPIFQTPALISYGVRARMATRFLEKHKSVMPENYKLNVGGRDMTLLFGLVTLRIGADSIAFDGTDLFWGPVNGGTLYHALGERAELRCRPQQRPVRRHRVGVRAQAEQRRPQRRRRRHHLHHRPRALGDPRARQGQEAPDARQGRAAAMAGRAQLGGRTVAVRDVQRAPARPLQAGELDPGERALPDLPLQAGTDWTAGTLTRREGRVSIPRDRDYRSQVAMKTRTTTTITAA